MLGRDQDILDELVARQGGSADAAAGAAAAAVPFHSFTARTIQRTQAEGWLDGRLLVWLDVCLPRDKDLLEQLLARSAVIAEALQAKQTSSGKRVSWADDQAGEDASEESGGAAAGISPALIDGSELAAKLAAVSPEDRERYLQWQSQEGGLPFFLNAAAVLGVSLVTPDGRCFLPTHLLIDSGCEVPLMDRLYGLGLGLRERTLSKPIRLRMANGELKEASRIFEGLTVTLKKGTADEVSCKLNFFSVDGLDHLAQAIYPTVADHQLGGMGVDRVFRTYRFRPRYATDIDPTVAEVPVRCWRDPVSKAVAAPARPIYDGEEDRGASIVSAVAAAAVANVVGEASRAEPAAASTEQPQLATEPAVSQLVSAAVQAVIEAAGRARVVAAAVAAALTHARLRAAVDAPGADEELESALAAAVQLDTAPVSPDHPVGGQVMHRLGGQAVHLGGATLRAASNPRTSGVLCSPYCCCCSVPCVLQ
jgi:hypothetical protein